jgi:hypothetical protein
VRGQARILRVEADDDLADVGIALGGGARVCGNGDPTLLVDRSLSATPKPLLGTPSPSPESRFTAAIPALALTVKGFVPP